MINTKLSDPCVLPDAKVEQYSETRIDWEEYPDSRTLHVEAHMTADELLRLVERLMPNGQRA